MNIKRLALLALLTSVALIIFVIELQIPPLAPVPGMKIGLANIITVYAVYKFSAKDCTLILLSRVILGSLIAGNMISLIYSLSGGMLCLLGMLLLRKAIDKKHIWVCSILGAVLHNIGQTAAALAVMQTTAVLTYLPFLTAVGCIAGLFTGICAQMIVNRLDIVDKIL